MLRTTSPTPWRRIASVRERSRPLARWVWTPAWDLRAGAICLVLGLALTLVSASLLAGWSAIALPGLKPDMPPTVSDGAVYSFETGSDGWAVRGALTNAVVTDAFAFAGQDSLEVEAMRISSARKGFIYITHPRGFAYPLRGGRVVTAHLFVPGNAPPFVAALYALDGKWGWHDGGFPVTAAGKWNTLQLVLPRTVALPIREMGVLIIGSRHMHAYSGPLFLDSVNLR